MTDLLTRPVTSCSTVENSLPTQPPHDMTKLNILRKFDIWQLMMLIKHLIDPVPKPDGEGGK